MRFFKLFLMLLLSIISHQAVANSSADDCLQLFNDADYSSAVTACQLAAEQGDAASQTMLGEMYDAGDGVVANQKIVAKWWIKAAEKSYLPAQNLLALKYYYGGDVFESQPEWKQDYKKAYDIWKQSAYKGVATSQYMMGEMNMQGQGVSINYVDSYAWFKIALEGGYKLATDSLIELSRVITANQKQQGMARISSLKNKIAH
ncbi:MAG: sel1 repeat family protein [Gammaproteobacteria bacterium]|nr:sel1 repeat family protein [Gammaproteobacteria bacterium]MBT3721892.1 sel1 repeat family protein [Gammaproteobacteria bacterium]MBT4077483.1 sel1 repeat family protein [Gammaproteobacteria bacterium]MBT4196903.1 sel1 repeat family protein [Gammaproteobacteria bacterium]MBT4451381.1 sel1 repeat family protein [Gammaproteobacteria bacterium]